MLTSPFKFRNPFSRGLGLLLIAFIFFATTVSAAHNHGRVSPPGSDAASFHSEQTAKTSRTTTGCNDCLICQLHQNLNTTLITHQLVTPPQPLQLQVAAAVPRDVLYRAGRASAGRAPPFIS